MREKISRYIRWCEKVAESNIWNLIEEKYAGWIIGITSIIVFHWSVRTTWNAFDLRHSLSDRHTRFVDQPAAERYFVGLFPLAIALITGWIIFAMLRDGAQHLGAWLYKSWAQWRKPKPVRLTLYDTDKRPGNREARRHPPR